MNLNQYQIEQAKTSVYPDPSTGYLLIALIGEVGEVFNVRKKELRNKESYTDRIKDELGDVIWYLSAICNENGQFTLQEVWSRADAADHSERTIGDILRSMMEKSLELYKQVQVTSIKDAYLYYFVWPILVWINRFLEIYDLNLEEVLDYNIKKLQLRAQNGELKVHE